QIDQPVERTLDIGPAETGAGEVGSERGALRWGQLIEDVAVEDVDQNVENAAVHHPVARTSRAWAHLRCVGDGDGSHTAPCFPKGACSGHRPAAPRDPRAPE